MSGAYRTTLAVGGEWELEVPVLVTFTFERGYPRTWEEPGCPDMLVDEECRRLDGLPMHDGIDAAFGKWWRGGGEDECLAAHLDGVADARDRAEELRWQARRDDELTGFGR